MAKVTFTPQQRQAIDAPFGNLLVSAAAGSGKTAVLTERVLRLLTKEDPVAADRLIIVTFTVAASIEMRQRIEQKLSNLLEEDPQNELLKNQQFLLMRAKISTIHALCSGLIQEHFHMLQLPPRFRMAEETEIKNLENEELEALLEEEYQAKNPTFLRLAECYTDKDDRLLQELVGAVYRFIRRYPFPLSLLPDYLRFYDDRCFAATPWGVELMDSYLIPELHAMVRELQTALELMGTDALVYAAYEAAFTNDLDTLERLISALSQHDWDRAVGIAKTAERLRLKALRGYEDRAFLERLQDMRKGVLKRLDRLAERFLLISEESFADDQQTVQSQLVPLFSLVERYFERVALRKREESLLDYSDLEHFALELLVTREADGYRKTPLAEELSERYAELLVDECQDINYLQNLIFWALAKGSSFLPSKQAVAEAGNLFMVGDVKQSIYRFRNAVPDLFVAKRQAFPLYREEQQEGEAAAILLQHNFRSRPTVTEPVNHLFRRLMSPTLGGLDYTAEEELTAAALFPEHPSAQAELHILNLQKQDDATTTADMEADYIAELIANMVRDRYEVSENGVLRPCRYRDFCVLLRAKKGKVDRYLKRMREYGLSCFAESSNGYFDAPEIATMLQLLRVIDNPLQDIALFAVLLSPLFCFTPDELAAVRLQKRKGALYFGVTERADAGDGKCERFLTVLSDLRKQAAVLPIEQLIQLIYDQTGFLSLVEMQESGEQKRANLCLLLSYAANYEALGGRGVDGFLRYLDRAIARGEDFTCANIASERADVVRIMSIHGSKGLEYPICIIADTAKTFNEMDLRTPYLLQSDFGIALKTHKPETHQKYSNLSLECLRQRESQDAKSEELRVLYVAATRAKEKLIFVGSGTKMPERVQKIAERATRERDLSFWAMGQNNVLNWLLAAFCNVEGFSAAYDTPFASSTVKLPIRFVLTDRASETEEQQKVREFREVADPSVVEALQKRLSFQYGYAPLTTLPAKVTATQLAKEEQGEPLSPLAPLTLHGNTVLDGAARGTILHSFMQYADFVAAEQHLEQEIERLTQQGFLQEREAEALNRASIHAFLQSALYTRMKHAKALHREYAFLYAVQASRIDQTLSKEFEGETVLMQGIADLVLEEDEGIVIVDYKTDVLKKPEQFVARYQEQLRLYRQALSDYFQKPVTECLIYALHLGQSITVDA